MRKKFQQILKTYFYHDLIKTRKELNLSQAKMAERLMMDNRSYIQLDHGKFCCSGLTLALYLIYCSIDPILFLNKLQYAFEKEDRDAA